MWLAYNFNHTLFQLTRQLCLSLVYHSLVKKVSHGNKCTSCTVRKKKSYNDIDIKSQHMNPVTFDLQLLSINQFSKYGSPRK